MDKAQVVFEKISALTMNRLFKAYRGAAERMKLPFPSVTASRWMPAGGDLKNPKLVPQFAENYYKKQISGMQKMLPKKKWRDLAGVDALPKLIGDVAYGRKSPGGVKRIKEYIRKSTTRPYNKKT